jgi:hypothetical protein
MSQPISFKRKSEFKNQIQLTIDAIPLIHHLYYEVLGLEDGDEDFD